MTTTSPFTNTYSPTFTRSVVVEGDLTGFLLSEEICEIWARRSRYFGIDLSAATGRVNLYLKLALARGEIPMTCLQRHLTLTDVEGKFVALVPLSHEPGAWGYLPFQVDPLVAARDVGGPTTTGEVNGGDSMVAALAEDLGQFLSASAVRQLVDPGVFGPWVSECLARTWAWLDGGGAFDAPAEVLAPVWEQAAGEIAACFRQDSCGWLFQSLQGWNSYLVRQVSEVWMWEQRPPLDLARRALIRVLAPLAKPYGVILGEGGDFLIRDDADEDTAREVCRRALTDEVVESALLNTLQADTPDLDALYSLPTPQETDGEGLPPVEVAEHQDTTEVLTGLELFPGEGRRFAAVWRSITTRHAGNIFCRGIAPIEDSHDWLVWWSSNSGEFSDRQWVVEFRLCSGWKEGWLAPWTMRILTTSADGSGQHLQPEIILGWGTSLVRQAFRRLLISEGAYRLALGAFIEGREEDVLYHGTDLPHVNRPDEECLARGLEFLHTLTPAQPVDGCRIPVRDPDQDDEPTN